MKSISCHVFQHALQLAIEVKARAVVVCADAIEGNDQLHQMLRAVNFPTILVTRKKSSEPPEEFCKACTCVAVPDVHMTRSGQVKVALLVCLAQGVLVRADRVVCLTGVDGTNIVDTLMVLDLGTEPELFSTLNAVAQGSDVRPEVFERTLALATQLAVEGREGCSSPATLAPAQFLRKALHQGRLCEFLYQGNASGCPRIFLEGPRHIADERQRRNSAPKSQLSN